MIIINKHRRRFLNFSDNFPYICFVILYDYSHLINFFRHDSKRTISSSWNSVLFSLINCRNITSNFKVRVQNHISAYTQLSKISDKYEPYEASFIERFIAYFIGEQIKGIQTVEKMLLANSALTAIGEVSLMPDGQLTINIPSDKTLGYFLTTDPIHKLIDNLIINNTDKELLTFISKVFFTIGGAFSMYWLYLKYKQYAEQYAERQRLQQMNEHVDALTQHQRMDAFNERNDDNGQDCTVCLSARSDFVIIPCGHICICSACSQIIDDRCPICRGAIQSKHAVYHS